MNLLIKNNIAVIRVIIYIFLGLLYYIFLYRFSPLGINWRDTFYNEFNNSIHNILNNFSYTSLGLTSPSIIQNTENEFIHLYPAIYFFHFALIKLIFGNRFLLLIAPIITNSIIFLSSILTAEITIKLLKPKINLESFLLGTSSFMFFLCSPWTYRMIINPHREIYFFLGLVLSIYLSLNNSIKTSKLIFILGCFYQYQWGFFFSFFNITLVILSRLLRKTKIIYTFLIFKFKNFRDILNFSCLCLIPTLIAIIQNISVKLIKPGITLTNSSALSRIGIDNGSNIYHGGYLGALQFLGGNRIAYCLKDSFNLQNVLSNNINTQYLKNIFTYHCILTIANCFVLSVISIIGISLLIRSNTKAKKVITSLIFSIILFISIFQQTWSAHLSYYSYSFSVIFAMGTTSFYKKISDKLRSSDPVKFIFSIPIIMGIIISLIKSNYMIN